MCEAVRHRAARSIPRREVDPRCPVSLSPAGGRERSEQGGARPALAGIRSRTEPPPQGGDQRARARVFFILAFLLFPARKHAPDAKIWILILQIIPQSPTNYPPITYKLSPNHLQIIPQKTATIFTFVGKSSKHLKKQPESAQRTRFPA